MMRSSPTALAAGVLASLWLSASAPRAAELALPQQAVVLTVVGNIQNTNRAAFDPHSDAFLNFHDKKFTAAAEFDRPMLEALGSHEVVIDLAGWPAPLRLAGPRLKDVIAAVGGAGSGVTLVALDGYASEIAWADLQALDWIVATRQDGKPLGIGQRGPLWVVYSYPDGRALSADDELRWPWAAFFMEIN